MKVEFDRHAIRRMKERRITDVEVKLTVEHPEYLEQTIKGRINAFKQIDKRFLRVTYRRDGDGILVITAVIRRKPFKRR